MVEYVKKLMMVQQPSKTNFYIKLICSLERDTKTVDMYVKCLEVCFYVSDI